VLIDKLSARGSGRTPSVDLMRGVLVLYHAVSEGGMEKERSLGLLDEGLAFVMPEALNRADGSDGYVFPHCVSRSRRSPTCCRQDWIADLVQSLDRLSPPKGDSHSRVRSEGRLVKPRTVQNHEVCSASSSRVCCGIFELIVMACRRVAARAIRAQDSESRSHRFPVFIHRCQESVRQLGPS